MASLPTAERTLIRTMIGWIKEEEQVVSPEDLGLAAFLAVARGAGLPRQRRRVLELGCGPSGRAGLLAPHFDTYLGVDPDALAVGKAQRSHSRLANARFSVGSGMSDVGDDAYDLVVCDLARLPRDTVASELLGLLATGGLLLVSVPRKGLFGRPADLRNWPGGRIMWIDKRRADETVYCIVADATARFEPVLIHGGL